MRKLKISASCFLGLFFLGMLVPTQAFAYLDPGSGSYFLQLLAAGLLAASFAVKTFWSRIRTFFAGIFTKKEKDASSAGQ